MSDVDTDRAVEQAALRERVKWLIGLRLLVAFLFLGSAAILAVRYQPPFPLSPLFILVACTCLLSIVYLLLVRRTSHLDVLCSFQVWIDFLLVTALVYYTGGIESLFAFTYLFPILAAAILISRRASLLMAGLSSVLYGALINAQLHGLMGQARFLSVTGIAHDPGYVLFQTFVNSVAFFLVALLASHLAERLTDASRELQEQRADLRNLQSLHRDIVANIPSGIVTLDLKGKVVTFNEGAQKIIGRSAEEMLGRNWQDTPFREIRQLEEFFSSPAQAFWGLSQEIEVRRKDGRTIPIGINLTPLKSSEGISLGLVGIFQDLTERKKIEARLRQSDRLAAVGRLAAGLAHEVRNPLAAISGSVQLMKEEGTAARPQLFDLVLREADRLKLVTGQFLDFAKPTLALEKPCNLVALMKEAVSLLERSCDRASAVTISFRSEADQILVAADRDQLKQVFWNLGLNAIQAMPAGGELSLAVRKDGAENGEGWAAVEFADTGRGIPPGEVDRIFDPFYTTKPGGTGLGLAIARKIIDSIGGRIEVVSGTGDGATFRVYLQQAPSEARQA